MTKLALLGSAALLLLTACTSTGSEPPVAGGTPSGSPSGISTPFPSASASGAIVPLPSSSPFPFEQCEPDHIEMPAWVPSDLPLPEGIFATETQEPTVGYERAFFVIPGTETLPEITRMIVKQWPKAGYQLGRGDSEVGEIEAEFSKPPAVGAFKIRATACDDPPYSVMLLIYAPTGPAPSTPTPVPSAS